jgi:hypothetical protein
MRLADGLLCGASCFLRSRTIYVRDADVPLFDRAQDELGKSVSALFAEFLKERLGSVTESEKAVLELIAQSRRGAGSGDKARRRQVSPIPI